MDVIELIAELQEKVDKSFELPIVKKAFINKEEIMKALKACNEFFFVFHVITS